eukprot:5585110-Pyramimonas_sp.AAC.3
MERKVFRLEAGGSWFEMMTDHIRRPPASSNNPSFFVLGGVPRFQQRRNPVVTNGDLQQQR